MRKLDWKTTTFETGHENFLIDIVESVDQFDDAIFETWLYRKDTGIKTFVVGEMKKNSTGKTVDQYAREIIRYIRTVDRKGFTFYDTYDQDIEDLETATCERIRAEKDV